MKSIHKIKLLTWFALTVSATSAAKATSVSIEADAISYFLKGYSAIIKVTETNGLTYALGTGRFELPEIFIEWGQSNQDTMQWNATCEAIQVARVGYRFSQPRKSGFSVEGILMNQIWRVESESLSTEINFKTLHFGVAGGYYVHLIRGWYLFPIISATADFRYAGASAIQGNEYKVAPFTATGSIHAGFEF